MQSENIRQQKKHNDMTCSEGPFLWNKKHLNERGGDNNCVRANGGGQRMLVKILVAAVSLGKAIAESGIYWPSTRIRSAEPRSRFHFGRLMRSPQNSGEKKPCPVWWINSCSNMQMVGWDFFWHKQHQSTDRSSPCQRSGLMQVSRCQWCFLGDH